MGHLDSFLKHYRIKKFSKGEIILCEDEIPASSFVVKSGVIKTYNLTSQGQEKPISFDINGDIFPLGWVFGKIAKTQYFYEAFSDSELYCVPRDEFIEFLKSQPGLLYEFVDSSVKRHVQEQMRINSLEQSKAHDKVLYTIYYLCLRFGKELKTNTVKIQLPLTQQDLANFMGLTRETTGIELKKLERAGVLKYIQQRYVVYTDKLDGLLDDDYDKGRIIE